MTERVCALEVTAHPCMVYMYYVIFLVHTRLMSHAVQAGLCRQCRLDVSNRWASKYLGSGGPGCMGIVDSLQLIKEIANT